MTLVVNYSILFRFRTVTTAYYRGAMGILLVFSVTGTSYYNFLIFGSYKEGLTFPFLYTDELTFTNTRGWLQNIRNFAMENVSIILLGNDADKVEERVSWSLQSTRIPQTHPPPTPYFV